MPKRVKSSTWMKQKARYYQKHRVVSCNSGRRWRRQEIHLVVQHALNDVTLHLILGRSVAAIQTMRHKAKHRK